MDAQLAELDRLVASLSSSAALAQAEQTLDNSLKSSPDATLTGLARLANLSNDADNRAQSLILLKRLAFRAGEHGIRAWTLLDEASHQVIKDQLLQAFVSADSRDPPERHVACDVAAHIHKATELVDESWPQLMQTAMQAPSPQQRESGFLVLSSLSDALYEHLANGDGQVLHQIAAALRPRPPHVYVSLAAFDAACSLLAVWADGIGSLWSSMMEAISLFTEADDLDGCLKMLVDVVAEPEVIAKLAEAGHLQPLLALCVAQASRQDIDADNKGQLIEVGVSIAETSPEAVFALGREMYVAFIVMLLQVMTEVQEDAEWAKKEEKDEDDDAANVVAEAALDRIALALSDDLVLPTVFAHAPNLVKSSQWQHQHAGLSAIASILEGCGEGAEAMCGQILELITPSFNDANPRVRHAALYTLAQLCSHLEGKIQTDHAQPVLTLLFNALSDPEPRVRAWAAAAVVNFLDLEIDQNGPLTGALSALYGRLFALASKDVPAVGGRALAALSSLATSAGTVVATHYGEIMPLLLRVLTEPGTSVSYPQQSAMDCVASVAKAAGATFQADADNAVKLVWSMHERAKADDDASNAIDALTALTSLAEVAPQQAQPLLPALTAALLELATKKVEVERGMTETDTEMELIEVGDTVFAVNPNSIEEKTAALENLHDLAGAVGAAFAPYAQQLLEVALPALKFFFSDTVRLAAASLLPAIVKVAQDAGAPEEDRKRLVNHVSAAFIEVLSTEDDPTLVAGFFEELATVYTIAPNHLDAAGSEAFASAVEAQLHKLSIRSQLRANSDEDHDAIEQGAASDEALLETCSSALKGWFGQSPPAATFARLQGHANAFIQSNEAAAKRWGLRFAVDLVEVQGARAQEAVASFLPPLIEGIGSNDAEIRRAACFGVGILAEHGGGAYDAALVSSVEPLLRACAAVTTTGEDREPEILARDNAVSAVGKLIRFAGHAVDAKALTPRWVASLPIELDGEEMEGAYALLLDLVAKGHEAVNPAVPVVAQRVVALLAYALHGPATSHLPSSCAGPIRIGLAHYLAGLPPSYREEVPVEVQAQLQ